MNRLKTFGEYLFALLPAAFKKGTKAANQFYLFFKVVGKQFDGIKADIFTVRRESMISTASEAPCRGCPVRLRRATGPGSS